MITKAAPKPNGPAKEPDYRDMPFYWFLRWDQATARGDTQAADHAQQQMERLDYLVIRCPGDLLPVKWFLRWVQAVRRKDHQAADNAQQELRHLGYTVGRCRRERRRRCPA